MGRPGKLATIDEAIQWLRDVANAEPDHPRATWYLEAAQDLEERRPETAAEMAKRLGFKPHGKPVGR